MSIHEASVYKMIKRKIAGRKKIQVQHSPTGNGVEINEEIKSDFLISPGDIYPNRKVELQMKPEKRLRTFVSSTKKHSVRTTKT